MLTWLAAHWIDILLVLAVLAAVTLAAMKILKGESGESVVEGLLSSALSALTGSKRELPEGEDVIELPTEE